MEAKIVEHAHYGHIAEVTWPEAPQRSIEAGEGINVVRLNGHFFYSIGYLQEHTVSRMLNTFAAFQQKTDDETAFRLTALWASVECKAKENKK